MAKQRKTNTKKHKKNEKTTETIAKKPVVSGTELAFPCLIVGYTIMQILIDLSISLYLKQSNLQEISFFESYIKWKQHAPILETIQKGMFYMGPIFLILCIKAATWDIITKKAHWTYHLMDIYNLILFIGTIYLMTLVGADEQKLYKQINMDNLNRMIRWYMIMIGMNVATFVGYILRYMASQPSSSLEKQKRD